MRHLKRTAKLGRTGEHRNAMLANMVCSLIKSKRITTTLAKAKVLRPVVEKLVTLGRRANRAIEAAATADDKKKAALTAESVHCRRLVAARVRQQPKSHFKGSPKHKGKVARDKWRENEDVIHILFDKIAPQFKDRNGGYTRILKLGERQGDAAQEAILEFVEGEAAAPAEAPKAEAAK
ncbi:MAG: large subunit ribosomal protein L17 [Limisphaerales bacterium]|nr:MAG: large subunit ribosomal protein L17 [Limisphaerales bacterium]KAG0510232.1 MAG: large subunit ribosomal protein L17 [Limisphaerales bacterium]TXT51885.1 MAG: large subunit ribosomal protein L17 [Limisphaerales bacterium]